MAGGPAEEYFPTTADYLAVLGSSGLAAVGGDSGLVTVGLYYEHPEGQDPVEFSGAYLWASPEGTDVKNAKVHVGPKGGLSPAGEGEGEGEGETTGPIAEMAIFGDENTPVTASLTMKGNQSEGEITLRNATQASITASKEGQVVLQSSDLANVTVGTDVKLATYSATPASITVSDSGSVFVQLGGMVNINNTDSMSSAPSFMPPDSVSPQTGPSQNAPPVSSIGIHSMRIPLRGS